MSNGSIPTTTVDPSSRKRFPVTGFELSRSEVGGAQPEDGWIPAIVPGGVHESLLAAGLIPHPYIDSNEAEVRWVEERDWWYRATVCAPAALVDGERLILDFAGLDTVVDIWLDGVSVGHHENMFRPLRVDVTHLLRPSSELLLRFSPPLAGVEVPAKVTEFNERLSAAFGGDAAMSEMLPRSTVRRKASFSWGWDFGPRLPSIGIWLPVALVREQDAAITGHHVRTVTIDPSGTAEISIRVEVEAADDTDLYVSAALLCPDGRSFTVSADVVDGVANAHASIDDAQLWWTHDLGSPDLHDVTIELHAHRSSDNAPLDRLTDRIGLRTIELNRSPDPEGGRLFQFVLNGIPVFARGAAWLPPDMMVGSVTDRTIARLVRLARDGGMNMLRVWGGGIYEHDSFYAACDAEGVLIWHDFMFACTDYPGEDPMLAEEVRLEARFQVTRLRNRASMALWAGNNEVQMIHGFAWHGYDDAGWGDEFFRGALPATVAELAPGIPYWPGSPWGEDESEGWMAANGVLDGDRHAWEVWHGFDFGAGGGEFPTIGDARHYRRYALDLGKFISEFGIHASPELSSLQRWIPSEPLEIHSPAFDDHNKDSPKDKHDPVLEIVTGLPTTMQDYVDFTMISQAEGLKFGIEHYRRRQPHCSGTLVWQLNDVWPGFSWSVIDYDLVPKAGYYTTKRAFAPVIASFRRSDDGTLELWVSNAGRPATVTLDVSLREFGAAGAAVLEDAVTVTLGTAETRRVWCTELTQHPGLYAWVEGDGIPTNRLFFSEVKDLPRGETALESTVVATGPSSAQVTVRSSGYGYLVHLLSPAPGARFSENYFDLRPGTSATVEVSGLPLDFDPDGLVVRSL